MKLVSVNVGQRAELALGTRVEQTGIYKAPMLEPVTVNTLGLEGDFIFSSKHHGGPDQAVYIYGTLDYDYWSKELGFELAPGTFGENLTISELESASFSIGDRLEMGQVILEVSAPRIPCAVLAARMSDAKFVKRYRQAGRPGLYCRVIQTGKLQVGDAVRLTKTSQATVTLLEVFHGYYEKNKSEEFIRRQLAAPVAIRVRLELEPQLKKLLQV